MKTAITTALIAALLLGLPLASAASTTYYAQTTVVFNVPSDATFSIAMPADYGSWTSITGTVEGSATATDYISFNYSSVPQAALQEPYQLGSSGNAQNGAASPIYYIDNTGNTDEQFDIKLNQSMPSNVELYFNATCVGSCGTVQTAEAQISTSYQQLASAVTTSSYLNVTLWSNVSSGASAGETDRVIYIRSTAV
jgi:hypothetical protein